MLLHPLGSLRVGEQADACDTRSMFNLWPCREKSPFSPRYSDIME